MMSSGTEFAFNDVLHALRDAELRQLPKHKELLSAGCSGQWYFDWIDACCEPTRHVGVELYSPKPASLAAHCQWIPASIAAFPQVGDQSIDIVFSGQNIEHLWADDITGFLLEARRVLRADGLLVVDTPNRSVTMPLVWLHPEHTAEFTGDELRTMFSLAGFETERTTGHWLIRDEGRVLPLVPSGDEPIELATARRVSRAAKSPDDAFSLWTVSRVAKEPNAGALREYVTEVWTRSSTERARRSIVHQACRVVGDDMTTDGTQGFKVWGPYVPLRAGRYRLLWSVRVDDPLRGRFAQIDVTARGGTRVVAERTIDAHDVSRGSWIDVPLDFELNETTFGLEFRLRSTSDHVWSACRHPVIEQL